MRVQIGIEESEIRKFGDCITGNHPAGIPVPIAGIEGHWCALEELDEALEGPGDLLTQSGIFLVLHHPMQSIDIPPRSAGLCPDCPAQPAPTRLPGRPRRHCLARVWSLVPRPAKLATVGSLHTGSSPTENAPSTSRLYQIGSTILYATEGMIPSSLIGTAAITKP